MSAAHDVSKDKASILGPTLKFKGELSSQEDLVIHGQVEGRIGPAPRVTIGPEAVTEKTKADEDCCLAACRRARDPRPTSNISNGGAFLFSSG